MSTIYRDRVEIGDLAFNKSASDELGNLFYCDLLDGWDDTAEPQVVTSAFGYSDGVVAADRFPLKEHYLEFGGYVMSPDELAQEKAMDALRAGLEPSVPLTIVRQGPIPKAMDVRAASKVEFPQVLRDGDLAFRFLVRLMAPWPFKYSPVVKEELAGVFTGGSYFRTYTATGGRRYSSNSGRTYTPDVQGGGVVGTETRRNHAPNPSFEVDASSGLTAYTKGAPTSPARTRVADTSPVGGGGFSLNLSGTMSAVTDADRVGYFFEVPAAPGEVWSVGAYLRMVSGQTGATAKVHGEWVNAGGGSIAGFVNPAVISLAQTTYIQRKAEGQVAPANTAKLRVYMWVSSGTVAGASTARFDMIQVEKAATLGSYFDGDTSPVAGPPQKAYGWDGTPHASASFETTLEEVSVSKPVPDTITIANEGNADAYPELVVVGPLLAGSWELINETTGESMSFDIDLSTGAELVIDNRNKVALIGGQSVDYYIRGEWIRLVRGSNTLRLSTAEPNPDARLIVRAADTWR